MAPKPATAARRPTPKQMGLATRGLSSRPPAVTVAVRVRPLTQKEADRGAFPCIEVDDSGQQIDVLDPDDKMGGIDYLRINKTKDKSYCFDHAFAPEVGQDEAFEKTAMALLPDVLERGKNACVFAYGATGSGKTFTMTGSDVLPGVIPQSIDTLFEFAEKARTPVREGPVVTMQYVEIYNESIKDLLQPTNNSNLDVREAPGRGTYVAGAAEAEVASRAEVEEPLLRGNGNRTTESTQMNSVSSRSHAVLQLRVEWPSMTGKLSLIDLAGSERASKTGVMAKGKSLQQGGTHNNSKRLNEGANINKSLLALANCINALTGEADGKRSHIPYRDSKLTRLLKDSLGGGCRTLMIANVSPASDQFDETLNTLKYADRAKRIKPKDKAAVAKPKVGAGVDALYAGKPRELSAEAKAAAEARALRRKKILEEQSTGQKEATERHVDRIKAARRPRTPPGRQNNRLAKLNDKIAKTPPGSRPLTPPRGKSPLPDAFHPELSVTGRAAPVGTEGTSQRQRGEVPPGMMRAASTIQARARGHAVRSKSKGKRIGAADLLAEGTERRRGQGAGARKALAGAMGDVPAEMSTVRRGRGADAGARTAGSGLAAARAKRGNAAASSPALNARSPPRSPASSIPASPR